MRRRSVSRRRLVVSLRGAEAAVPPPPGAAAIPPPAGCSSEKSALAQRRRRASSCASLRSASRAAPLPARAESISRRGVDATTGNAPSERRRPRRAERPRARARRPRRLRRLLRHTVLGQGRGGSGRCSSAGARAPRRQRGLLSIESTRVSRVALRRGSSRRSRRRRCGVSGAAGDGAVAQHVPGRRQPRRSPRRDRRRAARAAVRAASPFSGDS